ncbi:DNA-3-methyladenine glycosylase [Arabidopsis thaliana]
MKTPARRSKRVNQEESETNVTTRVVLRTRKTNCSKTRAARVRPDYPLTRTTSESEMKLMPPEFFQIDALDLAPRLLGKFMRRDNVVLRITEVEAYRPNDSACHGRFGVTPRTAPVFGPGGHAYVYLCYGLHMMLNIVADKEGVGAAVLIRSCSPVSGMETIQERRGLKTDKPVLLNGPGKVGQALGLSTEWSHHPLYSPGLELLDGGEDVEKVMVGPRVGIDYALPEHVNALWRFAVADTPWISAPKNTLKPL